MAETAKIDMRVRIREKCDLATIYADDGAYHSAARVLRELAEEVQRHAVCVGRLLKEEPPMTEPLKLRVGGVYLNRRGERVLIVHELDANDTYRFGSYFGRYYTPDGRWSVGCSSPYDLVSEVIEPTKAPPASLPADDLRTRAALAAMTGILAGGNPDNLFSPDKIAPWCVRHADALIAALKEVPK